jgi:hypothetical protein
LPEGIEVRDVVADAELQTAELVVCVGLRGGCLLGEKGVAVALGVEGRQ